MKSASYAVVALGAWDSSLVRNDSNMQQWYVMYTKPNKEPMVNEQLQAKGIETYFPFLQVDRGHRRGIRQEPLFPHYVFFRADLQTNEANGLRTLPGMRTIVQSEDEPLAVPEPVIDALRKRLQPDSEKVYNRAELFHAGQELLVQGGAFDGMEAIFCKGLSGRDRAHVFLKLVNAWTKAEIAYTQLRPRDGASMSQH